MVNRHIIEIASLSTAQTVELNNCLLNVSVDFSLKEASQISFSVIDPGFKMGYNNYFVVGRDVLYTSETISPISDKDVANGEFAKLTLVYEIASVSSSHDGGNSVIWQIEARPKGIQQMKRDRHAGSVSGANHQFIVNAALKYGMKAVVQTTTKSKKITITNGLQQADSLWTVMQNLASSAHYELFESDGIIYFGSQKFLLDRWGTNTSGGNPILNKYGKVQIDKTTKKIKRGETKHYIPFHYPTRSDEKYFQIMQIPDVRRSDNDPNEAEGSMLVDRLNGKRLRPGMTIALSGIPMFSGHYLISQVTYDEFSQEAVQVSFKTPDRPYNYLGRQQFIQDLAIGERVNAIFDVEAPGVTKWLNNKIKPPTSKQMKTLVKQLGNTPSARRFPSKAGQNVWPKPTFNETYMLEHGNVDLFKTPIINKKMIIDAGLTGSDKKNAKPIFSLFVTASGGQYVLLNQNICVDGVSTVVSKSDAILQYESDNLHYGLFTSSQYAQIYASQLQMGEPNLLSKRFTKHAMVLSILAGNGSSGCGC
jgi:hypothetical protein